MKFEIGQMVKCVDPQPVTGDTILSLGAVYTVDRVGPELVHLEGQPEHVGWHPARFVALDPLVESILEIQKKNA